MSTRRADARDAVIGKNIQTYRLARRMSQSGLGEAIGVTFQQVQKYEKGKNRVGSGRLVLVAQALQVPVMALFKGVPGVGEKADAEIPGLLADRQRLRLARAFALIDDTDVCRCLMLLTESVERLSARGRQPDLPARQTSPGRRSNRMPKRSLTNSIDHGDSTFSSSLRKR
jgi:transcriptional regulator with XRE-family HTH domain